MKVNKNVLSVVINKKIFNIVPDKFDDVTIAYLLKDGWAFINIHELTTIYKEWCYDQGYAIETRFNCPLQAVVIYPIGSDDEIDSYIDDGFGIGETEFEVVEKATEWVAKEKGR